MTDPPLILGIESTCDETAASVVAGGADVLSSVVASQVDLHARFGGVVPEIASRAHVEAVNTVIDAALGEAKVAGEDLHAVAVAHEPGLIGSLLVGLMAAKTLAWAWGKPLVPVNHVYAHAYSPALDAEAIDCPAAALICSGGHTALYRCQGPMELDLLGSTIDDAAGEAFDKVASILGLGYPGGPVIDRLAREGDPKAVDFPRSMMKGDSLEFSFSGLKTAVLYHVHGVPGSREADGQRAGRLDAKQKADIAASFQQAVVDVLVAKLGRAAEAIDAASLVIGGGVSANSGLRSAAGELAERTGRKLRVPPLKYCVDNAAMTAGLAAHLLAEGFTSGWDLTARATVRR